MYIMTLSNVGKSALAIIATLMVSACQSPAGSVDTISQDKIRVLALHGSRNFGGPFAYRGRIRAVGENGQVDTSSRAFEAAMKAKGFNIDDEHSDMVFEIKEVYAGPASAYKALNPNNGISGGTIAGALSAGAACWLLHACNNPMVMTNTGLSVGNDVASDRGYRRNADDKQAHLQATSLVVTEMCELNSCSRSYASTEDPSVMLNELRMANAIRGLPRSVIMK